MKNGMVPLRTWVSGIFEVHGGQVCNNREYWDVFSLLRTTVRAWLASPTSAQPATPEC